ncbi:MAG: GIY-YIG nuclease family protein [Betaproteobacteria bacterium]|nr:GIY-YIG nuclease family protein [Betaproteobacteria bacterium]
MRTYAVYILTNEIYGTLYIGMTNDLARRTEEHRLHLVPGFTKQHKLDRLVWYEIHETAYAAITREKQLKAWKRAWKVRLIQETNPEWLDLSASL